MVASKNPGNRADAVSTESVRDFWEKNPLFSGEGANETGSREWFREHEKVYIEDCFAGQQPFGIFTAGLKPNTEILDVGCGPGFWVRYFLGRGYGNVTACDLTARAVELTKRSLGLFGLKATVEQGDAQNLTYEGNSFEHVNCQGVIHHTPDPAKCLEEFHRVLKPGGTLCVSVYYKNILLRRRGLLKVFSRLIRSFVRLPGRGREKMLFSGDAEEIVRMYDGAENPLGRAYTIGEFKALLADRFEVLEVERMFFPARAMPVKIPPGLHRFLHKKFGLMVIFRCRAK